MNKTWFLGIIATAMFAATAQAQGTPLLVTPAERGVILRWVWPESERPAGYLVERRLSSSSPWVRLNPQPIARVRDRAVAQRELGEAWNRYAGLLFPDNPAAERRDPETFRGMQLLSADLEPGVARVLGLRYDDTSAVTGSAYEYRLTGLMAAGERVLATSAAVVAGNYRPADGPRNLVAASAPRGTALRWIPSPRFSGYHVYRGARRDGSDARRLTDAPVIVFVRDEGVTLQASATSFTDTAPPRDSAFYRVEGIDAFGRSSRRSASAAHVWQSTQGLAPPLVVQTRVERDTIVVTWQPSGDERVTSYQVWRAASDSGPFVRAGARTRTPEQRDAGRPAGRVQWYRVTAVDDAGRESEPSAPALAEIPDLQPPTRPDSLRGVADTGRMTLVWRHVPAPDLRGYRVYRAISAEGTFALLSTAPDPGSRYVDTIPRRADHPFYYRVTAVDSAWNESDPSAVVTLRPPDVTPPTAPGIAEVRALDGGLAVRWLANPEPDLAGYRLRFRTKGEPAWRVLPGDRPLSLSDTITDLAQGSTYEVSVVAVDDAGNQSPASAILEARLDTRGSAGRVDVRGAEFVAREQGVVVWWAKPDASVAEVLILRREGSGPRLVLASVSPSSTRFLDRAARRGTEYEYVVQLRHRDGRMPESRPRRVAVPPPGGAR